MKILQNYGSKMKFSFLILLIYAFQNGFSQTESTLLKEVIHHSPNVSTLGKFGEVPVGYYTGVPNISIPIYEAKSGSLSLPISLNYHAGGVKVEEVASNVGLSWSLNAGGAISRVTRGYPDYHGMWDNVSPENQIASIEQNNPIPPDEFLLGIEGVFAIPMDGEPDIFHFNFGGRSGKFVLDQNGEDVHIIPKSSLKISRNGTGWEIIDENGVKYLFHLYETTFTYENSFEMSWVLTSITSADSRHTINFQYEEGYIYYPVMAGETKYINLPGSSTGCLTNTGVVTADVNMSIQRLKQIDFEGGYVRFNYINERCDIANDKVLDEISVYSADNSLVKKFILSHSYFGTNLNCAENMPSKRLKLDSISEISSFKTKPPYVFEYDESEELPSRFSLSQDHWGYYNGANNTTLIPGFMSGQLVNYIGADRRVDPSKAQIGVLKSIKYPTGGSTNFTYESNQVNDDRYGPQYFENAELQYSLTAPTPVNNLPVNLDQPIIIPSGGAYIVTNVITGLSSAPWPSCDNSGVFLTKNGVPIGSRLETFTASSDFATFLEEGTYGLQIIHDCPSESIASEFSILIRVKIPDTSSDLMFAGGIRIKEIEDDPGNGGIPIVRKFRYTPESQEEGSSGNLINFPIYTNHLSVDRVSTGSTESCNYLVATSQSKVPLATASGSYVGYSHVVEELPNGSENRFSFISTSGSTYPTLPFAPYNNQEWRRGFLYNTMSYEKVGGQLLLVKEVVNTFTEFNETSVRGIKVGRTATTIYVEPFPPFATPSIPNAYSYYSTYSSFFGIETTTEKYYPEPGNLSRVLETYKKYTYDPDHFQLTEELVTLKEDNGTVEEQLVIRKFPTNYSFTGTPIGPEATAIKLLNDQHLISVPIEEYVVKQYRNSQDVVLNRRVVSARLTTFKTENPYPDYVYEMNLTEPVEFSSFDPSSIVGNSFQQNSLYEPIVNFIEYDGKGNLLAQRKTNDISVSYLWGYDHKYPVAEIMNSTNEFSTSQLPFTDQGSAQITTYMDETPILPSFEITNNQQISVILNLNGNGTSPPPSPLVNVILRREDGSFVSSINGTWGQQTASISVVPGTYQWYYNTDDVSFSPPYLTSIDLTLSNTYTSGKTGARIFYTSFEEEGNYSTRSYTGEKSFLGQYTVYLPAQNGVYNLTYFKWNTNLQKWELISTEISVTSGTVQPYTIGDAGSVIDEVRLHPSEAQMTTYTYKPLVGMTSMNDPNNITTFYEYDSFGRLENILDNEKSLLKTIHYSYKVSDPITE